MEVLKGLDLPSHPDLIQSFEEGADAGIFKLDEERALVFTADFFTPVVDDPFTFGQIAATNSLSDVYVVGGRPLLCLNLIGFPKKGLPLEMLREILKGGLSKIKEAGALLVGGHSVDDPEPKYGLAVVGLVHPARVITNKEARPGEILYLTKPLGTGILITAYKGGLFKEKDRPYKLMVELMTELNDKACRLMQELGLRCATDITGFGLLGHALEMALASKKRFRIHASKVPVIKEAVKFASMGIIPEGDYANLNFCSSVVKINPEVTELQKILLADAQTSGGFLISVPRELKEKFEEKALELGLFWTKAIGEVVDGEPGIEVLP